MPTFKNSVRAPNNFVDGTDGTPTAADVARAQRARAQEAIAISAPSPAAAQKAKDERTPAQITAESNRQARADARQAEQDRRSDAQEQSTLDRVAGVVGETLNALSTGPNTRHGLGISNRDKQIMTWRLPKGSSVQMYINPQNFVIKEEKQINSVRTKGGYIVQYWGDKLTELTLSGTTGSSGVKGINVLRDIYRAENKAFELIEATQAQGLLNTAFNSENPFNETTAASGLASISDSLRKQNFVLRPSLGSLALNVMLFYQGVQYRGFFRNFEVTENAERLGLFDYSMAFTATDIHGKRDNFMAWHKEPLADDLGGRLLNGIGNAIRGQIGLEQQAPQQLHPENAPLTFGNEGSLSSQMGFDTTRNGVLL